MIFGSNCCLIIKQIKYGQIGVVVSVLGIMAQDPVVHTAYALSTINVKVVIVVGVCTPDNVACKFLLTTNCNSSLVF